MIKIRIDNLWAIVWKLNFNSEPILNCSYRAIVYFLPALSQNWFFMVWPFTHLILSILDVAMLCSCFTFRIRDFKYAENAKHLFILPQTQKTVGIGFFDDFVAKISSPQWILIRKRSPWHIALWKGCLKSRRGRWQQHALRFWKVLIVRWI